MQSPVPSPRHEFSSLLIRGVNWLGDAVMTTPALHRLRERFPNTKLTILTDNKLAELWEHHPSINSILTFDRQESPWGVGRRLRAHGFDAALILPNSTRSAMESWLGGIPNRIGYRGKWRGWVLTQTVPHAPDHSVPRRLSAGEIQRLVNDGAAGAKYKPRFQHQVHDYLRLAAALGANPAELPPQLRLAEGESAAAMDEVRKIMAAEGHPATANTLWLGIHASAAYGPAKCWPADRFGQVTSLITKRIPNCVWLNFGAKADPALTSLLSNSAPSRVLDLAGKTSLRQFMGLLKECRVLLTNDSGPMHVAAALGTPVVVPFGSTSPDLTGPSTALSLRNQVLQAHAPCSPCFRRACPIDFRCMTGITVDQVTSAVLKALNQ